MHHKGTKDTKEENGILCVLRAFVVNLIGKHLHVCGEELCTTKARRTRRKKMEFFVSFVPVW